MTASRGIRGDSSGAALICGNTSARNFPVTAGAYQTQTTALTTPFVLKLSATGASLLYSTLLGGNARGFAEAVAVDSSGNTYVTGYTADGFPVTAGAFQTTTVSHNIPHTAFVTKLDPTGALVYSTLLDGRGETVGTDIVIDRSGNVYVVGETQAHDFPITVSAFQRTNRANNNNSNAFVTEINPAGSALVYSTYLGGTHFNLATGVALDNNGNVYIVGTSGSTDFPVTPGAIQPTNKGALYGTVFVAKLSPVPLFTDFNNDGHTDLLLQNTDTGQIASWFMNGTQWTGGAYFSLNPSVNYALAGVGSFAGDNTSALVLQNRSDDTIALWTVGGANSATITGGAYVSPNPPAGWKVVGVGDFNGDGRSDLVFQNRTTRQIAIWFMKGPNYVGGVLLPYTPPEGLQVVGVGDLNGDGFPDIVFQNQSTGQIAVWFMNGSAYAGGNVIATAPAAGWKVVGVGDYNGDGYADLVFQNQTTRQAAIWFMRGVTFLGGDSISLTPPPGWQIAGPR